MTTPSGQKYKIKKVEKLSFKVNTLDELKKSINNAGDNFIFKDFFVSNTELIGKISVINAVSVISESGRTRDKMKKMEKIQYGEFELVKKPAKDELSMNRLLAVCSAIILGAIRNKNTSDQDAQAIMEGINPLAIKAGFLKPPKYRTGSIRLRMYWSYIASMQALYFLEPVLITAMTEFKAKRAEELGLTVEDADGKKYVQSEEEVRRNTIRQRYNDTDYHEFYETNKEEINRIIFLCAKNRISEGTAMVRSRAFTDAFSDEIEKIFDKADDDDNFEENYDSEGEDTGSPEIFGPEYTTMYTGSPDDLIDSGELDGEKKYTRAEHKEIHLRLREDMQKVIDNPKNRSQIREKYKKRLGKGKIPHDLIPMLSVVNLPASN